MMLWLSEGFNDNAFASSGPGPLQYQNKRILVVVLIIFLLNWCSSNPIVATESAIELTLMKCGPLESEMFWFELSALASDWGSLT